MICLHNSVKSINEFFILYDKSFNSTKFLLNGL